MEIDRLIDSYLNWLRSEITIVKRGDYYEITSPLMDRNNDYLQLFVKDDAAGNCYFTDDGYIISSLEADGVALTGTRKNMLDSLLHKYGVVLNRKELTIKAKPSDFPQKKHMLNIN